LSKKFRLFLIGLLGGAISTLFGVGGGIVYVPAFNTVLKIDIKKSIGTSLACIVPTSFFSAISHYYNLELNIPFFETTVLILTSILFSQIGVKLVKTISNKTILILYLFYIFITSFKIILFPNINLLTNNSSALPGIFPMMMIGSLTGLISSLLGIGGGIVIVTSLVGIYGVDMIYAITISLVAIIPTTMSGVYGHYINKNIETDIIIPIVLPSAISAYVFSKFVVFIGSNNLQNIFSVFSLFVAFLLIKKNWKELSSHKEII
jgi:uncharacterized protein